MRLRRLRRLRHRFRRDRRGNVAVMSAILMTSVMGLAALGVDVGKVFTDRRKAQGVVDLAAIAAVSDLPNARRAAAATVVQNDFAAGTPVEIELGTYIADPATRAQDRFKPAATNVNAARVTLYTRAPLFFGRVLTGRDHFDITTRATATQSAFASFAIGSRLASLDGGLLNQLLGGLLGTNVSLSVMDYQALVDARLDLFDFMTVLGRRINVTAGTYDSLLGTSVKVSDVVAAMAEAERNSYGSAHGAVRALSGVAQSLSGATSRLQLSALLNIGPYDKLPLGEKPKLSVVVAAMDFLTATGQLANNQSQINVGLNVNIPGLSAVSLKLAVGERPKGTSWVTVGAEGASVHTAQTRLLLNIQLVGSGVAPVVQLPLYVELASATARLAKLRCAYNGGGNSSVTLNVTPAIVDAWIGKVSDTQFMNFKTAPNPPAAEIVNAAGLTKVNARAHATLTNLSATPVTFSAADIAAQTRKTVGTRDVVSSLLSRLFADADLDVSLLGLGLGLPDVTKTLVAGVLMNAAAPVDRLLSSVLASLGVGLGQADVWVLGQRCDGAVLVN